MADERHRRDLGGESRENSISLFDFASLLVRRRKPIAVALGAILLLTLVLLILTPNKYESTATILPTQQSDQLDQLKDLTGILLPRMAEDGSSQLYPVVLGSRLIRDDVLAHEYRFSVDDEMRTMTLSEYFDQENPDKLRAALGKITSVSLDKKTEVVSLAVETRYPGLSQTILRQYLSALETYNLHSRKSKAKENERYLARELTLLEQELLASQDSLRAFQEQNRTWNENAHPWVLSELARLRRDLAIKDQSFLFLSQEHEAAKLKVQMDIPIVKVLDEPSLPIVKSGPHRLLILIVVGLLASVTIVFLVVTAEVFRVKARAEEQRPYHRFRDHLSSAFPSVNRLILRSTQRKSHEPKA